MDESLKYGEDAVEVLQPNVGALYRVPPSALHVAVRAGARTPSSAVGGVGFDRASVRGLQRRRQTARRCERECPQLLHLWHSA